MRRQVNDGSACEGFHARSLRQMSPRFFFISYFNVLQRVLAHGTAAGTVHVHSSTIRFRGASWKHVQQEVAVRAGFARARRGFRAVHARCRPERGVGVRQMGTWTTTRKASRNPTNVLRRTATTSPGT